MSLDKNLTPNLVALALVLAGLALDGVVGALLLSTGLFALSGALTNWLAVHMLFERVPGLYGSGVIVLHFEEFKAGILRMVREQLLDPERIAALSARRRTAPAGDTPASGAGSRATDVPPGGADAGTESAGGAAGSAAGKAAAGPIDEPMIDLVPMVDSIDLDAAWNQLVQTITESTFGNMLAMVGGETALQPLKEPFKKRMRRFMTDTARSPRVQAIVAEQISSAASSERFAAKLDALLRARLDELTPDMVRDIMQQMIRRHLGWLVVWGGVFGGLIGLVAGVFGLYRP